MPGLKTVRMREVDAYECDGPTCRRRCEFVTGAGCSWLEFTDPADAVRDHAGWLVRGRRRWFCSYACLAEWARFRQVERPLVTHAATPPLPS